MSAKLKAFGYAIGFMGFGLMLWVYATILHGIAGHVANGIFFLFIWSCIYAMMVP